MSRYWISIVRQLAVMAMGFFLFMAVFGLWCMPRSSHSCPFMPNNPSWIDAPLEHFENWSHASTGIPSAAFLLFIAVASFVAFRWLFRWDVFAVFVFRFDRDWRFSIPPPLYQRLFARGLLHTKIP